MNNNIESRIKLQSRRYIGNKYKLSKWIFSKIDKYCKGDSFTDIFAGTGVVAAEANGRYNKLFINDFLYSNFVIYHAFFSKDIWDEKKILRIINKYNGLQSKDLKDNYFSINFGDKFFTKNSAKKIGYIREDIEKKKKLLSEREYNILLSSLIYATDKIANTVGHYDAYFKKTSSPNKNFTMKLIEPVNVKNVKIFREDANILSNKIKSDIVYIDPPYNSRQYSRFYHVLETLTKWDKPKLYGVALKPEPENMSDYCKVSAKDKLKELVNSLNTKYIVVSYNNTYASKSSSSQNKITLKEIKSILAERGDTKIFEKKYPHFNSGKTDFINHKENLFITNVKR